MEWRLIPGFPAYEINRAGIVRNAVTKYHLGKNGRRYRLSDRGTITNVHPFELVGLAFGDALEEPAPCVEVPAAPDDGRCAALERENAELKCEIEDKQCEIDRLREILDARDARAKRVHRTTDATMTEENAALENENRELRALVAELEAELQVYRVAI